MPSQWIFILTIFIFLEILNMYKIIKWDFLIRANHFHFLWLIGIVLGLNCFRANSQSCGTLAQWTFEGGGCTQGSTLNETPTTTPSSSGLCGSVSNLSRSVGGNSCGPGGVSGDMMCANFPCDWQSWNPSGTHAIKFTYTVPSGTTVNITGFSMYVKYQTDNN